ncbi:hypothetical protein GCM10022204_44450 [Microlunatus aurantiacus]|uniref:Uncharacterized protein n=1 Tax=Microlunatus aurantiacus TaxID=446786 RepID=A0ABP7EJX2_9ACTN
MAASVFAIGLTTVIVQILDSRSSEPNLDNVTVRIERRVDVTRPWVFPAGSKDLSTAPAGEGSCSNKGADWLLRSGALEQDQNIVDVILVSDNDGTVVIKDVTPAEVVDQDPAAGTSKTICAGGGPNVLAFDLDLRRGSAMLEEALPVPDQLGYYELTEGEAKVFSIRAIAHDGSYKWKARLTLSRGEQDRIIQINDKGKPFLVTS